MENICQILKERFLCNKNSFEMGKKTQSVLDKKNTSWLLSKNPFEMDIFLTSILK